MTAYPFLRQLLFQLDPETGHAAGMAALRAAQAVPPILGALRQRHLVDDPRLRQTIFGREVPNPVGLAAGFDKDALVVPGMAALGFGFLEVGTVTPLPQAGNPRPRLFRFPEAESLQNAMGFNNRGMEAMRWRLERVYPASVPLGINLGKNKATPMERALEDYETLLRGLSDLADYVVVNLSSPNTPGLRDLQNEAFVRSVLNIAKEITAKPVLVKIAPDLEPEVAVRLSESAVEAGAAGIIATNTTTEYSLLPGAKDFGGVSGKVLREKSFRIFEAVARRLFGRTVLISVGGIDSGAEAWRRLRAGASLVQVYTGLIYKGPSIARRINEELLALMEREGVRGIGRWWGRIDPEGGRLARLGLKPQARRVSRLQREIQRSQWRGCTFLDRGFNPGRGDGEPYPSTSPSRCRVSRSTLSRISSRSRCHSPVPVPARPAAASLRLQLLDPILQALILLAQLAQPLGRFPDPGLQLFQPLDRHEVPILSSRSAAEAPR